MTKSDVDTQRLELGFDFAKRLRSRDFRAHLKKIGWESGMSVLPALDDEPVINVLTRMIINQVAAPCLVVIRSSTEARGFCLMFVTNERRRYWWHRRVPLIEISPDSSIGMVYDALTPCGEVLPSEWSAPLCFRKAPIAA